MIFFNGSLILGLVLIFYFFLTKKFPFRQKLIFTTLSIIVIYRVVSYITIYFFGATTWWLGEYSDNFNHYQLGFGLLLICIVFKRVVKPNVLTVLLGISFGWIIDETSDMLKLFPFIHLPYHFRDSLGDLFVIMITYVIFAIVVRYGKFSSLKINE